VTEASDGSVLALVLFCAEGVPVSLRLKEDPDTADFVAGLKIQRWGGVSVRSLGESKSQSWLTFVNAREITIVIVQSMSSERHHIDTSSAKIYVHDRRFAMKKS